ncbi:MAG: nuclear transport factor 2 family protein [Phycisphaerales bacterium]
MIPLLTAVILLAPAAFGQPPSPSQPPNAPLPQPPAPAGPPAAAGRAVSHRFISDDAVEIEYQAVVPVDFKNGNATPVIIVLPPGDQSLRMALAAIDYFRPRCESEGWVVVSPIAPVINNKPTDFTGDAAKHIPNLLRDLRTWVRPEGNKFHLVGLARGGVSVFHIAPAMPKEFASITVMPGYPQGPDVAELTKLTGIPIRAFVGQDDAVPWHDGAKVLETQGKKLKLDFQVTRVPGETHVISTLSGGKALDVISPFRVKSSTMDTQRNEITLALDDFHEAASRAEEARYFAHFAPEGVFIGTDATERWTVDQFRAYARPLFLKGKGWTYKPRSRNIELSPEKTVAWFDELLDNEKYGLCRGSGVLRLDNGKWLITQYHLTVPVPNDLLERVANLIRNQPKPKAK